MVRSMMAAFWVNIVMQMLIILLIQPSLNVSIGTQVLMNNTIRNISPLMTYTGIRKWLSLLPIQISLFREPKREKKVTNGKYQVPTA